MTAEEYSDLHPIEFLSLWERLIEARKVAEIGLAKLTSLYVNAHTPEGKPMSSPADFMMYGPSQKPSANSDKLREKFAAHRESRKARLSKAGIKV